MADYLARMKHALDEFKAKHRCPPQREMRIHPEDLDALRREVTPLLTHTAEGFDHGMTFNGIALIADEAAPRLPQAGQGKEASDAS